MSGTLTAGSLSVAGISSAGALIGPYVTATSTTATSTFAGAVGIGTTSPAYPLHVNGSIAASGGTQSGPRGIGVSLSYGQAVFTNNGNSSNLFVGDVVGTNTTGSIGYFNTIFGLQSGANIPDVGANVGHTNSFFGYSAGKANTSGAGNSLFGGNAGTAVTTGGSNTYIGLNAGLAATTGSLNTVLGASASAGLTTGGSNTILGYNAGSNVTTGSNNIFIGKGVSRTSTSATNQLNIGQILFGDLSTGNVGIGQISPTYKLDVTGLGHFTGLVDAANFVATSTSVASTFGYRLGIGTSTPATKLHVVDGDIRLGSTQFGEERRIDYFSVDANQNAYLKFDTGAFTLSGNVELMARVQSTEGGNVDFVTSSGGTPFVRLQGVSGNVGIGTTTPQSKLSVVAAEATAATISLSADDGDDASDTWFINSQSSGNALTLVNGGTTAFSLGGTGLLALPQTGGQLTLYSSSDSTGLDFSVRKSAPPTSSYLYTTNSSGSYPFNAFNNLALGAPSGGDLVLGRSNQVVIQNSGNVGIGTTTPGAKLEVAAPLGSLGQIVVTDTANSGASSNHLIAFNDSGGTRQAYIYKETTSKKFTFANDQSGPITLSTGGADRITVASNGNVQFGAYGAGTLTTDGSGNITASSDERLKNVQGTFARGLADLERLEPILYTWKPETGFDATTTYAGFSAQNVQLAIPEAVGQGKDGFLTLQDRPLIATIVNAIKELANKVSETAHLVIERLTAKLVHSDRVETNELCVGSTCVTEEQFNSVFNNQSAAAGTPATTGVSGAPSGPSASGSPSADEGSINLEDDSNATTAATTHPTAANDNQPPADDTSSTSRPAAQENVEAQSEEPALELVAAPSAANDNIPPPSAEAI